MSLQDMKNKQYVDKGKQPNAFVDTNTAWFG